MALTPKQKQSLRAQAHALKPVVLMGQNGLTDAVMAEIDQALTAHELIKVRIPGQDRQDKIQMVEAIATVNQAEAIQTVGHVATFYRPNPDKPRIQIPSARR